MPYIVGAMKPMPIHRYFDFTYITNATVRAKDHVEDHLYVRIVAQCFIFYSTVAQPLFGHMTNIFDTLEGRSYECYGVG